MLSLRSIMVIHDVASVFLGGVLFGLQDLLQVNDIGIMQVNGIGIMNSALYNKKIVLSKTERGDEHQQASAERQASAETAPLEENNVLEANSDDSTE